MFTELSSNYRLISVGESKWFDVLGECLKEDDANGTVFGS